MAAKSNSSFVGGHQSPEQIHREFIQKPLDSAKQTLMGTGLELFNLLSVLPDAFIASQQRELKRVKATADKDDERVTTLQESITQATQLRTMIRHGEARVHRGLGSFAHGDDAFHGFVSNADLEPIIGLTVRLTGQSTGAGKRGLSATTEQDGYFRISFGTKRDTKGIGFSERFNNFSANVEADANATSDAASSKGLAQVEILRNNQVIHTDQFALPVEEGSVYREYVVEGERSRSEKNEADRSFDAISKDEIDLSENLATAKASTKKSTASKATKKASKK